MPVVQAEAETKIKNEEGDGLQPLPPSSLFILEFEASPCLSERCSSTKIIGSWWRAIDARAGKWMLGEDLWRFLALFCFEDPGKASADSYEFLGFPSSTSDLKI